MDELASFFSMLNFHNWVMRFFKLRENFLTKDSHFYNIDKEKPDYNVLVGLVDDNNHTYLGCRINWYGEDYWLLPFQANIPEHVRFWTHVDTRGL